MSKNMSYDISFSFMLSMIDLLYHEMPFYYDDSPDICRNKRYMMEYFERKVIQRYLMEFVRTGKYDDDDLLVIVKKNRSVLLNEIMDFLDDNYKKFICGSAYFNNMIILKKLLDGYRNDIKMKCLRTNLFFLIECANSLSIEHTCDLSIFVYKYVDTSKKLLRELLGA